MKGTIRGLVASVTLVWLAGPACTVHNIECAQNAGICEGSLLASLYLQSVTPTIMLGDSAGNIFLSYDGRSWTGPIVNFNGSAISSIIYANGRFWASTVATMVSIYYSTDGISWSSTNTGLGSAARQGGLAYGKGLFVTGGGGGPSLHYSQDGLSWTGSTDPEGSVVPFQTIESITFVGNTFAGGEDAGGQFMFASDGIDWVNGCSSTALPSEITYHKGSFYSGDTGVINIGVVGGGACATVSAVTGIQTMGSNGDQLLASGTGGVIYRSSDAINWSANLSPGGSNTMETTSLADPRVSIIAGQNATYYLSGDGGYNWSGPYTVPGAANIQASFVKAGFPY
ncbi:MAG: hypothetical protein H7A21_08670 [Spirochaetales bacterium]|nr:hypothetical protein [Leptospiraceae bacterium]MCP5481490.1 hypothetical protein [Spirochaetales bacterium]MCP5484319.1 hypothetical protein [Spirochaetales bacterium]